jgi:peptidoglycan/LPS O-acetylase OafA/YrhL
VSDPLQRVDPIHGLGGPKSPMPTVRKTASRSSAQTRAGHDSHRGGSEPRVLELDGLRALACLTIVAYHVRPLAVPFGWASVDLFFVLSGYLITAILIRHEGSPSLLRNFYVRRGLRIWPVYYLTILAVVVAGPWLHWPTLWDGLGYHLTYTQNLPLYRSGRVPPFSPYVMHFWTLANEEQFYIVWPLLVVMLGRRAIIPLGVGLAALSVAARARGFDTWLLLARADGFAVGGILAAILADTGHVARRLVAYRRGLMTITLLALSIVVVTMVNGALPPIRRPDVGAAFPLLAINLVFVGVVGLVATHSGQPAVAWLRRPRLVHIGTISYGLYVYHFMVLMLADDTLIAVYGHGRSSVINVFLLALTYALAAASWFWFEKPILGLKRRFDYRSRFLSSPCERGARGNGPHASDIASELLARR